MLIKINYELIITNYEHMNNKKQKAFTLFELLVSISIVAILTAIASMSFSGAQKRARDARRVQDMNSLQKAAEQYYAFSSNVYPINIGKWTATNGQVVLDIFPDDPKGVGATAYSPTLSVSSYCICAALESAIGNSNDTTCATFVNGTGTYYCVKNQQ
ncbi:MAG: type II secretion system protein [Candidatus Shapirobacteria bacterium]